MGRSCTRERAASSPLGDYLREIRDHDLLTADEEVALARAVREGDEAARARLIRANLRLVVKVARDFEGRGLALEDLVGEGNLGLIRAAKEFDPRFGTRFSTYASHWIKQAIRHALITTTATIRLPAHMVGLLTKWRRAERAYLREFGHAPTFEHLAVSLGLSEAKRRMVEQALLACRLLPGGGESDEGGALDEAADPREAPEAPMEADDDRRDLMRRLARLDDRERTILTLRFGLGDREPMTLKEIGRRLGVTREWVRKIEVRAVRKLDDDWSPPASVGGRRPRASAARRSRRPALQSA
ncbi:sigma-70 family RNA polymerase sigma factor [Tautonia sociabilis]|uniref:RNA polymerase sigma factor RpoD/SigA n=1 Tax=Tautonia sociabilis TaxID=2080755 RepID=A0A432MIY6_9BACT|nr:RNA polymerase sigma factor RpoD/SigA [Tautonia sociabilis]RUL87116.1 RNA polymerase sigma factor RpoD/SigA [Tautonia sociabilis]